MGTHAARHRLGNALDAAGVLGPIARARDRYRAMWASRAPRVASDGFPLPPARLRVLVAGHADPGRFIAGSKATFDMVDRTLSEAGVLASELGAVLDFGCGCGRVARQWTTIDGPQLHGCDYNADLAEWCAANLPFMKVRVNDAEPPSPYGADQFDLLYAVSILTHLTNRLAEAWVADFARILKPGGYLLLTTHGDAFLSRLTRAERERYQRGEPVVQRPGVVGTNSCAAFHPRSFVTDALLRDFQLISFARTGPAGQDTYLARVPGSPRYPSHPARR